MYEFFLALFVFVMQLKENIETTKNTFRSMVVKKA